MDILLGIDKLALRALTVFTPAIAIYRTPSQTIVIEKTAKTLNKKHYDLGIDQPLFWEKAKEDFDFNNKLVSTNLYASAGLFKLVESPKLDKEETEEWLNENVSSFFKIPNMPEQSILSYRIVDGSGDPVSLLTALINNEEIENIITIFKENQIILSAISFHNMHIIPKEVAEGTLAISYIKNTNFDEIILADQPGLVYYNQFPKSTQNTINEELVWDRLHQLEAQESHILGIIKENCEKTDFSLVEFSADKIEKFAESLADFSLNPSIQTLKVLPEQACIQRDNFIWGRLFNRFVTVLATMIIGLLVLHFSVTGATKLLINNLADKTAELRPQLQEIDSLRTQFQSLSNEYNDLQRRKASRTNTYLILRGLAVYVKKDIWLTSVAYNPEDEESYNTIVTGYSKKRSSVTRLLSSIENDENFMNVKLGYIKRMSSKEFFKEWKVNSSRYQEFQILFRY